MKYAIFSDIHSNLEALKAVQADMKRQKIDAAVCLGDIVGYGPDPAECLESVRAMKCPTVRGNHDHHAALPKLPSWFSPLALAGLVYSRAHLSKVQKKSRAPAAHPGKRELRSRPCLFGPAHDLALCPRRHGGGMAL